MRIYLDDARTPLDKSWIIVRNYDEFVSTILKYTDQREILFNTTTSDDIVIYTSLRISFDHDLADTHYTPSHLWDDYNASKKWQEEQTHIEKTGYDCAKWLVENRIMPELFWVHSANPVGADNILGLLNNYYHHYGFSQRGYRTFWPVEPNHIDDIQ